MDTKAALNETEPEDREIAVLGIAWKYLTFKYCKKYDEIKKVKRKGIKAHKWKKETKKYNLPIN